MFHFQGNYGEGMRIMSSFIAENQIFVQPEECSLVSRHRNKRFMRPAAEIGAK